MDGARGRARTTESPCVHLGGENHDNLLFSCVSCFSWFKCFFRVHSCPFVSIRGSNVLFFRVLSCPFVVQIFYYFRVFRAFRGLK